MYKVGDFVYYAQISAGRRQVCPHCGTPKPDYNVDVQECLVTRVIETVETRLFGTPVPREAYIYIQLRTPDGLQREISVCPGELALTREEAQKEGENRISVLKSFDEEEMDINPPVEPQQGGD